MFQVTFLLAVLLPYVALPFLRFPAETQPWAAVLGWLFVAAQVVSRPNRKVTAFDLTLVILATILMIHVYQGEQIDLSYYLRKNVGILLSLSILFMGRLIAPRALWLALVTSVTVYVFFGVLQVFSNPIYQAIGAIFVPLTQVDLSDRGIASLCPEATDFGFLSVYLLFFTLVLMRIQAPPTSMRSLQIMALVTTGCAVASMSGSGIIALAAVLSIIFLRRIRKPRVVILAIVGLAVVASTLLALQPNLMSVRGVQLLSLLVTSPSTLVSTTTFSYRFISNVIGIIALFESYGLGYGAGAYTLIAPQIYLTHDLGTVWQLQDYYLVNVRNVLEIAPSGVFPVLFLESGLIGVALVIHLWRAVYRSTIPFGSAALVLMTLAWAQSFPVAWPPFWLLIGLSLNPQFCTERSLKEEMRTRWRLHRVPAIPVAQNV